MQPIYEFGEGDDAKPVLHLAIANGFPPQTYLPLVQPFTEDYRVVSLPPRALWPGESPPETLEEWDKSLAQDFINGLQAHNLHDMIGVGHSFGGIATLLAAIALPERFKAVVLLDPTILPPFMLWGIRMSRWLGTPNLGNVMAQRAEKRRDHFESVQEAYDYFKARHLFADWPDETVRLYAESLQPAPDGDGLVLAWPKAWEAYYFRVLYTGIWRDLPKIRGKVPLLMIRGGESNTLVSQVASRVRRVLPEMAYAEIAGHGHLFPQSAPDETRQIIEGWLSGLRI